MIFFLFHTALGSKISYSPSSGIVSPSSTITSAKARLLSLSKRRYTVLNPGLVIFSTFSLILILGISFPSFSKADSLYTPPNTGSDLAVISLSPTPKESMQAPSWITSRIRYSSSELEITIEQSSSPASSSIFLACFVKYVMSPLSIRIPIFSGFISLKTRIAVGTPDFNTL